MLEKVSTIVFSVIFAGFLAIAICPTKTQAEVLFADDFDDYPTGSTPCPPWQCSIQPGVTIEIDDNFNISGKSLHFLDPTGSAQGTMWRNFAQTSYVVLEYYMMSRNGNYEGTFLQLRGDGGDDYCVGFGNAGGGGHAGYIGVLGSKAGWVEPDLMLYDVNTWYYVRRVLDCTTNTGHFYVEEVGNPNNNAYYSVGSDYVNTYIDEIFMWTSGSQGADCYIDEITIGCEPAEPNIAVSPLSHDFGDVELGTSSTVIVTISNEGSGDLTVSGIALETDFAITSVPPASVVVEPDETVDVEIIYTPTVLGYNSAVLKITSDDPDEPVVEVQLSAAGIEIPPPPSEQIANILAFFDTSVGDGTLAGDGPGNSAEKRLNALRNMIEAAGDLIENELFEKACQQLLDVCTRMDGQPKPPDFVTGEAVPELAAMVQELITSLGCE